MIWSEKYVHDVLVLVVRVPLHRQVRVLGMDKSKGVVDVTMDTELVKVRMHAPMYDTLAQD